MIRIYFFIKSQVKSLCIQDLSAMPRNDSRLMLAKFNEQLQPLYDLLREVEGIKLAPEVLEPEPGEVKNISFIHKLFTR